jgi:hypothetical protein
MFIFKPRLLSPPRNSKRPADLPPRWYRGGCLGQVIERDGRAVFIPGMHPALRDFGEHDLGIADNADDLMMANAEKVFREAQSIKKALRFAKLEARAKRLADKAIERELKLAFAQAA